MRSVEKVKTYPKFTHWQERWLRVWTEAARTAPTAAERLRRLSMAEFLGEIGTLEPGRGRGISSEAFVEGRLSAYREILGRDGLSRLPSVEQVLIQMEGGEPGRWADPGRYFLSRLRHERIERLLR